MRRPYLFKTMPKRSLDIFVAFTQVTLFAVLALLVSPIGFIFAPYLFLLFFAGLFVFVLGYIYLGLRSYSLFSKPRDDAVFVPAGVYRYLRHPIYSGVLLMGLAFVLSRPVWHMAAIYAVFVGVTFLRVYWEEHYLVEKYPEYSAYMSQTKRFIPYFF